MTSETKTTIEPGDVLAVEIECSACGARLSRTVKEYRGELSACQNCGAQWSHLSDDFVRLGNFIKLLRVLANQAHGGEFPLKVRFEIAQPALKERP